MDADALLHPRGPLPPGVYWRRRLLTLLAVLVVLVLLARSCGSGGSPRARLTPSPTAPARTTAPPASPKPSAKPSPSASAAVAPCKAEALELSARADAQAYPAGTRPLFTIGVRNVGTVPCTRDVGQAAREVRVFSGNDRVWSSDDCTPGGTPDVRTLLPGAAPVTFSVRWSRKRSAPTCPGNTREAAAGTYRVTARFGDLTSPGDTFVLR